MVVSKHGVISDDPKATVEETYIEKASMDEKNGSSSDLDVANAVSMGPAKRAVEERQLVRKLDMRLMPMIILIFIMNYIDVCFVTLTQHTMIDCT